MATANFTEHARDRSLNVVGREEERLLDEETLIAQAWKHRHFLRTLHVHRETFQRPSLESLRRYRDLWLPLVYQSAKQETDGGGKDALNLIPPPDIAWLWHCHRLSPFRYASYCQKRFRTILEANPPFEVCVREDDINDKDIAQTMNIWKQTYPQQNFFFLSENDDKAIELQEESHCLDGFDLLGSTERQATFLWQVSGPRFSDPSFLNDGVVQYTKFLKLKKKHPEITIVPTYQIDLFWHTHILSSISGYLKDSQRIIGRRLDHDDSLNDRSVGGRLDLAFQATKSAWLEDYGEDYYVEGGMYRGEPPAWFFDPSFVSMTHDAALVHPDDKPMSPFARFIGIQDALSTDPNIEVMDVMWCWKAESAAEIDGSNLASQVVGDPSERWVKYPFLDNETIEAAYQDYGKDDPAATVTIKNGTKISFEGMMWIEARSSESSTLFEKHVQRFLKVVDSNGNEFLNPTLTTRLPNFERPSISGAHTDQRIEWIPSTGETPLGQAGHIRRSNRSTTRGVNANPRKSEYIFGGGDLGIGYYHVTTKDAYKILNRRIEAEKKKVARAIALSMCCACNSPSLQKQMNPAITRQEKLIEELTEIQELIQIRLNSDIIVGGEVNSLNGRQHSNKEEKKAHYTEGMWFFPNEFYDAGGGCGAGTSAGGCGSIAGACGASGCGDGGGGGGGGGGGECCGGGCCGAGCGGGGCGGCGG